MPYKCRPKAGFLRWGQVARQQIESENAGHLLPRNEAPNKTLLKAVVAINTLTSQHHFRS
jgi:hypothetical protein